ncbi:Flagellin protein FlaA [hydrothermal vent metagenome]|uniref:Flagellin protein FlaA n=1 Tax=hydrothermal vent metagenome TaxID=652676 RepID=A0A3B1A8Y8_9ZZZZ
MGQVINTNIASLNSQRNLTKSQGELGVALQRLSSGLRINSAKDDAAGLAISERFTTQIRGLNQASRNANDAISLAQTAEGALGEYGNILQRVRELALQSANSTNSASDRAALQGEAGQLISELQRVATTTQFNGQNIIDGSFTGAQFQVGANANQTIIVTVGNAQTSALGSYQVGNTASAVNGSALLGGDLTINGVDVGVSVSGSAESVAAAINSVTTSTGVKASASTTTSSSISNTLLRNQTLQSGDLLVNGVNIGAVTGSNNVATQGASIATAINNISAQTGVSAVSDLASGALTLTSSTGKNIEITSSNGVDGLDRIENATALEVRSAAATASTGVTTFAGGALGVSTVTIADDEIADNDTFTVGGVTFDYGAGSDTATTKFIGVAATGGGSGATNAGTLRTAIAAAITAGDLTDVTSGGAGSTATVTSAVMTSTTTQSDFSESVAGGLATATTNSVGAAGVGVGDTLTVGGRVYEFTVDGTGAATGNVGVSLAATDAAIAQNFSAAVNAEYAAARTNIQASGGAAAITLTSDLLGTGVANLAVAESGAGVAGVSTAGAAAGTAGAAVAFNVQGTLALDSSTQFSIAGNNTTKAGLASASATLNSIDAVDISTVEGANAAIALMDGALDQINSLRGDLGAVQNRFESTIANLSATSENLSAARSRIRDTDYAAETAALTRAQILQQAGVSILSQANSLPQLVLSLLQ